MVIMVKMKRLINKFRDQVVHLGYNDKGQDEEKNKEMERREVGKVRTVYEARLQIYDDLLTQ